MRIGKGLALAVAIGSMSMVGLADVVFDFESGAQEWGSFGPITTDSGMLPTGGAGGTQGRFHVGDFDLAGWGMVDISPFVDLSGLTTLSVDAKYNEPVSSDPFIGTADMEMMLAIGYAEWTQTVEITQQYDTYTVDFVDLAPNYYASIAPYFGVIDLANPGLKIQLVMRAASGSGILELDYDNVLVTPEPLSAMMLCVGVVALRRRR